MPSEHFERAVAATVPLPPTMSESVAGATVTDVTTTAGSGGVVGGVTVPGVSLGAVVSPPPQASIAATITPEMLHHV